ncbi:MAG: hypothetical protein JWR27_1159 [Aeromicrobium sp.]|jgi:hypothetical protein|nr:hypothetical protein [Aeromicrobium sp.]
MTVPDSMADDERHEGVVVALHGYNASRPLLTLALGLADHWGCALHAVRTVSVGVHPCPTQRRSS